MAISCVYCGGRHETSAEVRAVLVAEPVIGARHRAGGGSRWGCHSRSGCCREPAPGCPAAGLGRNVVVRPGQSSPDGWSTARRTIVDSEAVRNPAPILAELRHLADERTPCVFEIDDATDAVLAEPQVNADSIHTIGPRFTFELSELHHLLWSNSVDARDARPAVVASGPGSDRPRRHSGGELRSGRRRASRRHRGVARRWPDPLHRADRRHRRAAPHRDRTRIAAALRSPTRRAPTWLPIS